MRIQRLLKLALILCIAVGGRALTAGAADVTEQVETLGNPYSSVYASGPRIYARNIWVMFAYQGRIYLGAGNSSNEGPGGNAGPVPIISFDPKKKEFKTEWKVPDEQIDEYHRFSDGLLYIPGHDPKEPWALGNFYRKEKDGSWKKHRTIPNGIHNYSMAEFDKRLFAATYAICISEDYGKTWREEKVGGGRKFAFFCFPQSLYAIGLQGISNIKGKDYTLRDTLVLNQKTGKFQRSHRLNTEVLYPDTELTKRAVRPDRAKVFESKVLYLGGYEHNDHQLIPFGAYVAKNSSKKGLIAKRIHTPRGTRPWDILVKDSKVFLLLEDTTDAGTVVRVLSSSGSLRTWKEILFFQSPTFARSFEYMDGYFYFGLGCEVKNPSKWTQAELKPATGNILRVKWER